MVPPEGFEPSRLPTSDFKSAVSAIPPRGLNINSKMYNQYHYDMELLEIT